MNYYKWEALISLGEKERKNKSEGKKKREKKIVRLLARVLNSRPSCMHIPSCCADTSAAFTHKLINGDFTVFRQCENLHSAHCFLGEHGSFSVDRSRKFSERILSTPAIF